MILKLENIPEEGLDLQYEEGKPWFDQHLREVAGSDYGYFSPILVHLEARRSLNKEIFLNGSMSTQMEALCSRCLERFHLPIVSEVCYTYFPWVEREPCQGGEGGAKDFEEPDRGYYDGESVDLSNLIREQLLLDAPRFSVCREDCRGLCSRCGTNLNEKKCSCVPGAVEGPFSVLKTFRPHPKPKKG